MRDGKVAAYAGSEDGNGKHARLTFSDGRNALHITTNALLNSGALKAPVVALHSAIDTFGRSIDVAANTLNEAGLQQKAQLDAPSVIGGRFQEAVSTGVSRIAELDRIRAGWFGLEKVDPAAGREARDWLRHRKPGDAVHAALEDHEIAAAALAKWNLSGLPNSIRPQVEDRLVRANLTDLIIGQRTLFKDGSAENPLNRERDVEAGQRIADEMIAGHQTHRNELDMLRKMLASTVSFAAVSAKLNVQNAYALLAGK